MGTFTLIHFFSFVFSVSKLPVLTLTGTVFYIWTALCLNVAVIRLESPRKDSPYLIRPAAAPLVLRGWCVEMFLWSRVGFPETIVLWAWRTVWKKISCLMESQPTLFSNENLDQNLLCGPHTTIAAVSCWTCKPLSKYWCAPPHTVIK